MASDDVPVTIVGGGPVGLATALALARFGVRSRVLEQKETTTDHPKARGMFPRAMEIFRQWGVEDPIRGRGLPPKSDSFTVLDGMANELGRSWPEPFNDEGPSQKSLVAQDAVEEVLFRRLAELPDAEVLWNTRALAGEVDGTGVTVTAEDVRTGERRAWRSEYLVGADGGAGICARMAGIAYEGPPQLALMLNTYFRADLSAYKAAHNSAGLILTRHEGYDGEPFRFLNTNGADRWLLLERIGTTADERLRPRTEPETIDILRKVLRTPDLDIRIINEAVWRLTRRIAARFKKGRVFLAGDAAHRFPPTGGFGLNSGIEDVHNLAWKLAFVLQGKAPESLLESYDIERRAIANANADMALRNNARFQKFTDAAVGGNPDRLEFWLRDMDNHTNSIGHVLGFIYEEGALVPDGSTPPPRTPRTYTPTDRPGSRFPHFWLDEARTRTSLDLFDQDFVLVVGRDGEAWADAAREVSRQHGLPILIHRLDEPDPKLGIAMGPRGAALVRPDGVTAWRIGWPEDDPVAVLGAAVDTILKTGVRSLQVGGLRLAFRDVGAGPPVVIFHGAEGDHRVHDLLQDALAADFRVISFDQRDCGGTLFSGSDSGAYDLSEVALDAVRLLDVLGLQKASFVGLSLGGLLAQIVAIRAPERVERLVLGVTWPASLRLADLNPEGRQTRERLSQAGPDSERKLAEFMSTPKFVAEHPEIVETLRSLRSMPSEAARQRRFAALAAAEPLDPAAITHETLVLSGACDQLIPPALGERLAGLLPRARFEIVPEAGHLVSRQSPALLAALIREHFHGQ